MIRRNDESGFEILKPPAKVAVPMLTIFRNNLKPVLFAVTIIICFAFGWFYVKYDTTTPGAPGALGSVYGRGIGMHHLRDAERSLDTALELDLPNFDILSRGSTRDNFLPYLASLEVVRHEARRLGLAAGPEQIEEFIRRIPAFQTNGMWDPERFRLYAGTGHDDGLVITRFTQFGQQTTPPLKLSRRGMNVDDFYRAIADYVLLENLLELIGAGLAMPDLEVERSQAIANQTSNLETISFRISQWKEDLEAPEEELKAIYEAEKERFMTPEKMVVAYVVISPQPAAEPADTEESAEESAEEGDEEGESGEATPEAEEEEITDEERTRLAMMADRVITAVAGGTSLADAAKAEGLEAVVTAPFDFASMPEEFEGKFQVQQVLGRMSASLPLGSPVREGDSWWLMQLQETIAPEPRPFEEVREEISTEWIEDKARELATTHAGEALAKLKEAVAGGKSFTEAAAEGELPEVATLELSRRTAGQNPGGQELVRAVELLAPGEITEPVVTSDSVVLAHVVSREVVKSETREIDMAGMRGFGDMRIRREAFLEWWQRAFREARFVDKLSTARN